MGAYGTGLPSDEADIPLHPRSGGRMVFSSDDFGPGHGSKARLDLWHDVYNANYGETDILWKGDGEFHARSEFIPFEDVVAGNIDYMFHEVSRSKRQIVRDSREDLIIGFMQDAPVRARLGANEIDAPSGSVFFYSTARPVEFRNEMGRITGNTVVLPHSALAGVVANLDDQVGRLLDKHDPAVALLARYVELLLTNPGDFNSTALNEHVRHTLVDLASIAVGAKGDPAIQASERGRRHARLMAIKTDIRESIGRADVSPRAVAARHGITSRYLHILFEGEGKTFSEFVTIERLAKAYRFLADPRRNELRIGDLAFSVGFVDISTFNRQFKRQYGMTPTELRATASSI